MSRFRVETRPETPTVGITETVTMTGFAKIADRIPEIVAWLAERDTQASPCPTTPRSPRPATSPSAPSPPGGT
ncbi:hypothetical protein [Promicromonospora iranensis]|uniref:Uncharacterized protein n=1 Tax=Promicromonospora iranensis TaxID=1105144 RepID=A0ABU2CNN6_9MICO|nr:hypothetical protein [Promicromonospora iranensis]MDR7382933.1 hypothetical protein [Promicromonospora iranensis]